MIHFWTCREGDFAEKNGQGFHVFGVECWDLVTGKAWETVLSATSTMALLCTTGNMSRFSLPSHAFGEGRAGAGRD